MVAYAGRTARVAFITNAVVSGRLKTSRRTGEKDTRQLPTCNGFAPLALLQDSI